MKKNKLFLVLIVLIGIFAFNYDVKADWVAGYEEGKIEFNIYNDETKEFEKQEIITWFYEKEKGILYPTSLKKGDEVYIVDEKMLLPVPKKEGYYFVGWYLDKDFKTPVTSYKVEKNLKDVDLKLYGKWTTEQLKTINYVFGTDVYIVKLTSNCSTYDGCTVYGEYLYYISNQYMTNEKEKINELPALDIEDNKFLGWHKNIELINDKEDELCMRMPIDKIESAKLTDLISLEEAKTGYISLTAKWSSDDEMLKKCETRESTSTPEPTPESVVTTGTEEPEDNLDIAPPEEKPDYKLLDIGISAGIIITLMIIALLIYKSHKIKIKEYMQQESIKEQTNNTEENKDIENKE